MRDLAGHQELQRIFGACVITETDEALIHDLGAGLGGDVAAKIDIEFTGDLEVVGGPGIALRIKKGYPSAAGDRDQGIGFRGLAVEFRRQKMQPGEIPPLRDG